MSDNLYLFTNNNGGQAENNGNYRLYDMKIDGDSEGVESGVDYVNYLQSDGNSWIDTGIPIITGYRVEVEIMKFKHVGSTYVPICGVGTPMYYSYGVDHADFGIGLNYSKLALKDDNQGYVETQTEIPLNARTTIKYTAKNVISKHSLPLFTHGVTSYSKFYTDSNLSNYAIIYSFRIFDENNRLIQDLRPCLDTKGIPCMYDEVSKRYLPNKGTGTFKYKKSLRKFQPVLDSNNIPCLLDKINKKYYYNKGTGVFNTKEKVKYKKLKYIQGDKASYINTGLIGKDIIGYNVEIKCLNITTDAKGYLFGIVDKNNNIHTGNIGLYGDVEGNNLYLRGFESLTKTLDGEARIIKSINLQQNNYTSSIFLFAGSEWHSATLNEPYFFSDVAILYFKVFDAGDNLVMHLIPAMDTNNKIGMYDLVSEQFFYNQGTGTFGYEIEELAAPQVDYVEYLESTGTQYIDTEIPVYSDTSYEITVMSTGDLDYVFGVSGDYNTGRTELKISQKDCIPVMFDGGYKVYTFKNNKKNVPHNIKMTPTQLFIDEVEIPEPNWGSKIPSSNYNMRLFGYLTWDNKSYCGKFRVYEFKTYRGEKLIQNLRPCLDEDDIPCMYDEISKKYFYNKGAGQFSYGKELIYTHAEYIESNGTQYIDTGVVPNSNTDIDMTCRLNAMPYYYAGYKCQLNTPRQSTSMIIEMDFKYANVRSGKGSILGYDSDNLSILEDGTYSLDRPTSTNIKASTTKYDKIKLILNLESKKKILYVNNVKAGEAEYTINNTHLSVGGSYTDYCSFYTHYVNAYRLSDMTPLFLLRPHLGKYTQEDFEYTIPKLKDILTGTEYKTQYGDALANKFIDYGYDSNYIYNKLKLINLSAIQNSSAEDKYKPQYDKTVYEYNGVATTVKPNLVVSSGATLTMGTINMDKLSDDDIEVATNNGWSIL